MSHLQQQFDDLCAHAVETSYLVSTAALLEWDQQTKLPSRGGKFRSEQLTHLAGLIHQRQTDPKLGDLLGELVESSLATEEGPASDTSTTLRELKRQFDRNVKVPGSLVESIARASSLGQQVWVDARRENDFAAFAPTLKEIFNLKSEQADAVGFGECRYDALLDEYEPNAKTSEVAGVLDALQLELVALLQEIGDSPVRVDSSVLHRDFPQAQQAEFVKLASAKIGFNYDRGRLDVTHHPFCTEIGPDDCRITTRYDANFFNTAFFGTLHEAGHGMYEQGLRGEKYGLPTGQYCSLGIHESQSRLWENLVGRSRSFWQYFFPIAQSQFPEAMDDQSLDQFYAAVNEVSPSLIRVEADEATYNLHIIIRFELERALIDGDLQTEDLPEAWNQKYQDGLGVTPPDDASGVMQDVHWSAGLVGYFPTYSLGNLYASQLFEAAGKELGDLDQQFARGDFHPLKQWLNKNIHSHGKCLSANELCVAATGEELSHQPLINHLRGKLGKIYQIS